MSTVDSTIMFIADGFYFRDLFNFNITVVVIPFVVGLVKPVISVKTILDNVLHALS